MQRSSGIDTSRIAAALPWALLLALAAVLALQDIHSLDYWWHLRTGQLIAQTGSVPRTDPYTFTVHGARWIDIHWLHQLALWGLYRVGGHAAVVLAIFACVLLLLALLAPIGFRRERPLLTVAVLALMLMCVAGRLLPRPELPTFVLLAAVLHLLDRFERSGDAWIYAIVPLQLVWVNVHGLFALGIALCGLHLAAELMRPLLGPDTPLRWDRVRRLSAVTALAAAACLANPNGLDGALYPLPQLRMVGSAEQRGVFGHFIQELQPTLASQHPVTLVIFGAMVVLSAAALALEWRTLALVDLLVWGAFLYLGLGAERNVALFGIAAAPILVRNANAYLDRRPLPAGAPRIAWVALCAALGALVAVVASGNFYPRIGQVRRLGLGVMPDFNPVAAMDWIEHNRPPGPIEHTMEDGGYLLWRLYPEYLAMSDGRLEVFGPEIFARLQVTTSAKFRALDAQYHFGTALAHYRLMPVDELISWWYASPEWRLVHVDDVAVVFVRAREGEPFPYPEVDLDDPLLFPTLDGSNRYRDELSLRSRTRFFLDVGRKDLALATWRQAMALFPGLAGGDEALAALQRGGAERAPAPPGAAPPD